MLESQHFTVQNLFLPPPLPKPSSFAARILESRKTEQDDRSSALRGKSSSEAMWRASNLIRESRSTSPTEPDADLDPLTSPQSITSASPISLKTLILLAAFTTMLSWPLCSYPPPLWVPSTATPYIEASPKASPSANKDTPSQPLTGEEIPEPSGTSSQRTTPPTVTGSTST